MEKFKKFLKIIAIVLVVYFVVLGISSYVSNYLYTKARTIDESVAFKCVTDNLEGNLKFVIHSTPKSREGANYYSSGQAISKITSNVTDERVLEWLPIKIVERDIDYLRLEVPYGIGAYVFGLDRKNFKLKFNYRNSQNEGSDYRTYQCKLADYEAFKQEVIENSALESNII